MKNYVFYAGSDVTGKKTHVELEDDLTALVKKYGSDLSTHSEITKIIGRSDVEKKITKLYEIPNQGAINIQISSQREIEIANIKVDGFLSCLGFLESSEYFQRLHKEIKQLCNVYHPDRI